MYLRAGLCVAILIGLALEACSPRYGSRGTDLEKLPHEQFREEEETGVLAEVIAYSGHGKIFDEPLKEIVLTPSLIAALQQSMIDVVTKVDLERYGTGKEEAVHHAQELLHSGELEVEEELVLRGAILRAALEGAPSEVKQRLSWRNEVLLSHVLDHHLGPGPEELRPDLLATLERLDFFVPLDPGVTDYIGDCRTHDVPIPPDWAETGTPWVLQGTLTTNLLAPGEYAAVWTYTDPKLRGGCVALPRGNGGPGSPAGIICQSATTGHACFWDNKTRGVEPERFLGWRGLTLDISTLKDGSNLNDTCPSCHRGDNVFLISPDDPTWAKLLRGPLSGPRPGTFTTRVESSSDNRLGHPRYIPISTLPERPGWQNAVRPMGCAGACHETPSPINTPWPMPPDCARPSINDPSSCYGNP